MVDPLFNQVQLTCACRELSCLQDGINAQWQAFNFSNAKYPLANVTLNGQPLDRNEYQVGCHGREQGIL
jgi:hypothetical protein